MSYNFYGFIRYTIIGAMLFLLSACSDFLSSIRNENNQSIESLLYNLSDLDVCVNGAYGAFSSNLYFGTLALSQMLGSDEITNTLNTTVIPDFSGKNTLNYFFNYNCNYDDYQAGILMQWTSFVNNNCNVVIQSIEKELPTLKTKNDSLNADRLLGEAFLMRATCVFYNNFYIGRQFHVSTLNSPSTLYRKKPILSFEDMPEPRKTVAQVYRFVIDDLKQAEILIPEKFDKSIHPTAYQFRCKRNVATAMLAKVYFQKNDFDSALIYVNKLLGNTKGSSTLFPLQSGTSYARLFQIVDKTNFQAGNNSEIIMGFHGNSAFLPTISSRWNGFQWTAFKNLQNGDVTQSKFRLVIDSSLVIRMLQGDTSMDVRFRQMMYVTRNQGKEAPAGQWTTLKYAYPTSNIIWLRAAEFHLMRAEIYVHINKLQDAVSELNLIRARAGLDEIGNGISKNSLMKTIIDERSRELCFENVRRWDNLRLASLSDSPVAEYLPEPYKSGFIPMGNRKINTAESLIHWNNNRLYCLIPENEYLYNTALER